MRGVNATVADGSKRQAGKAARRGRWEIKRKTGSRQAGSGRGVGMCGSRW